jgi:hypothetical protein
MANRFDMFGVNFTRMGAGRARCARRNSCAWASATNGGGTIYGQLNWSIWIKRTTTPMAAPHSPDSWQLRRQVVTDENGVFLVSNVRLGLSR